MLSTFHIRVPGPVTRQFAVQLGPQIFVNAPRAKVSGRRHPAGFLPDKGQRGQKSTSRPAMWIMQSAIGAQQGMKRNFA